MSVDVANNATFLQWIVSDTLLLHKDYEQAVGVYNNSIFLIGGAGYTGGGARRQVDRYDIATDSFFAEQALSDEYYFKSQSYTQIAHNLYLINNDADMSAKYIYIYNMQTKQLITNYFPNQIPINTVYDDACLASAVGYLYILGGRSTGIHVQILDISTKQWLDNVPSMLNSRKWFACIVDPNSNYLYAIGSHTSSTKSIERVQTRNITFNTWIVSGNLSAAVGFPRCVFVYDKIWVIGGYYGTYSSPIWNTDIHLIHSNGTASLSSNVSYGQYGAAVIFASNRIYVFGGRSSPGTSSASVHDTFMYYSFPLDSGTQVTNITATNTSNSTEPINNTMETLNTATLITMVISNSVFDDSDISRDEYGLILALAITGGVLFICILVFVLICYLRRRKGADSGQNDDKQVAHRNDRIAEGVAGETQYI